MPDLVTGLGPCTATINLVCPASKNTDPCASLTMSTCILMGRGCSGYLSSRRDSVDVLSMGVDASTATSSGGGKGRMDPSGGSILYCLSECLPECNMLADLKNLWLMQGMTMIDWLDDLMTTAEIGHQTRHPTGFYHCSWIQKTYLECITNSI